ncbi:MAG TPA: saccharopine dehydrogenase NADP-binding domain-containing protein [Moraxellaceae bacterium]|nr:saccharopine dehydrogenase NADP-binding domain-containing protein [Moraxellaceae bacterium]
MAGERQFDLVLFGATGFTGGLVADYLAQVSVEEPFRWAIAGRNPEKLESVRARLAAIPGAVRPALIMAGADDADALSRLAASTVAVITTVGPYEQLGGPLAYACAAAGTHYADLAGEPRFVHRLHGSCDALAKQNGARLVPSCGFESIPPDIMVMEAVRELRRALGDRVFNAVDVVAKGGAEAHGRVSGGTWQSAIGVMAGMREWWGQHPAHPGENVHAVKTPFFHEDHWQRWALLVPTIDPEVVMHSARVRRDYGHTFSYGHYLVARNPLSLAGLVAGAGGLFLLAQFDRSRRWLLGRLLPGEGPGQVQRDNGWFTFHVTASAGGVTVVGTMRGGDPFYGDTARMLAEAGLCLALDRALPAAAGVLTPASAMGERLVPRLQRAGLTLELRLLRHSALAPS